MKARILWIEGKRAVSPSFVPNLRNRNYEVETVLSGTAALARVVDFDPDLFLRNFEYGRISTSNDQTIREFTIIAEDDKVQEISPGVFYNVWTFNGTVPGPTIRATEGDLVRIHFINNGSKSHTMHFHGIHRLTISNSTTPVSSSLTG